MITNKTLPKLMIKGLEELKGGVLWAIENDLIESDPSMIKTQEILFDNGFRWRDKNTTLYSFKICGIGNYPMDDDNKMGHWADNDSFFYDLQRIDYIRLKASDIIKRYGTR